MSTVQCCIIKFQHYLTYGLQSHRLKRIYKHILYTHKLYSSYSRIKRFTKVHAQKIKLYLDLIRNLKTTMFVNSPKIDISVCSVCLIILITLCPSKESEFLDCSKIPIHVCFHQHNPDFSVDLFQVVVGRRNY